MVSRCCVHRTSCFHSSVPGRDSNDSSHCVAPPRSSLSASSFYCSRSLHLSYVVTLLFNQKSLPSLAIMQETTGCNHRGTTLVDFPCSQGSYRMRPYGSISSRMKNPLVIAEFLPDIQVICTATALSRRQSVTMYFLMTCSAFGSSWGVSVFHRSASRRVSGFLRLRCTTPQLSMTRNYLTIPVHCVFGSGLQYPV